MCHVTTHKPYSKFTVLEKRRFDAYMKRKYKQIKQYEKEKSLADTWFRKNGRTPPSFMCRERARKKRQAMHAALYRPISPPPFALDASKAKQLGLPDNLTPNPLTKCGKALVFPSQPRSRARRRGLPPVPEWPKKPPTAFQIFERDMMGGYRVKEARPILRDMWERRVETEDRILWEQAAAMQKEKYHRKVEAFAISPTKKGKNLAKLRLGPLRTPPSKTTRHATLRKE